MKKFLALLLALAMMATVLVACGDGQNNGQSNNQGNNQSDNSQDGEQGDATLNLVEDGKLIMATNAAFPPYEMVADGEGYEGTGFEGIDVEIAYAIAQKLGLQLQIDDMDFDSALLAVQNNAADVVLAGLSYNEERDEDLDFTEKYATGIQVVIVKEGSDVTLDNLGDGKLIGTQRGTTGYTLASYPPEEGGYGEENVLAYDNGALAVQALKDGAIDAVIIDKAPAESYVAANEGLTILPGNWVEEDYCIAVDEGNPTLLEAVQAALSELQADGTIQSIIDKYIKAD